MNLRLIRSILILGDSMELFANDFHSKRIRALLTIFLGFLTLLWSALTFDILVIAFGIFAISDGIFVFFGGVSDRSRYIEGIFYAALGVAVLAWPNLSEMLLLALIVARMLVLGFFGLFSWGTDGYSWSDGGLKWLNAAVNFGFGLFLLLGPYWGLWEIIRYIGVYWVIMGIIHYIEANSAKELVA